MPMTALRSSAQSAAMPSSPRRCATSLILGLAQGQQRRSNTSAAHAVKALRIGHTGVLTQPTWIIIKLTGNRPRKRGITPPQPVNPPLPLPPVTRLPETVEAVRRDAAGVLAVRERSQRADVGQRPLAPVSVLRRRWRQQDGTPFAAPAGRRILRRRARLKQRAGCQDQREQQAQARG